MEFLDNFVDVHVVPKVPLRRIVAGKNRLRRLYMKEVILMLQLRTALCKIAHILETGDDNAWQETQGRIKIYWRWR